MAPLQRRTSIWRQQDTWDLLGVKEQPELKFHKETGILIAMGDEELIEQIPMVLQQLPTNGSAGNNALPPLQVAPRPAPARSSTVPQGVRP